MYSFTLNVVVRFAFGCLFDRFVGSVGTLDFRWVVWWVELCSSVDDFGVS